MAKRVHKPARVNFVYAVLFVLTLLIVVAIVISVRTKNDQNQLTAWATARSNALHSFIQLCHQNGGDVDVSPEGSPQIVFTCNYPSGQVERYVLEN